MSYTVVRGYRYTQVTPSTTWVINHKLGLNNPIVDVFVDVNGTLTRILPLTAVVTDENNITLTFTNAIAGSAEVM